MAKTLNFWTVEKDGDTFLVDTELLGLYAERLNVTALTEAQVQDIYGEQAHKRQVVLKPNSYRLKHEIARLSQRQDATLGLVHDPELVQAARAAAVVDSWNLVDAEGKPAPVSIEGFQSLAMNVAEYVDAHVFDYLCPEIARDPSFLEGWQRKLPRTDNKPKAPKSPRTTAAKASSPTSTSTAASRP